MAGFFDFIKNPNQNTSTNQQTPVQPANGAVSQQQKSVAVPVQVEQSQPYSGIGNPPGGRTPYSGIGTPPVSIAANPQQPVKISSQPVSQEPKKDDSQALKPNSFTSRGQAVLDAAQNKAKELIAEAVDCDHLLHGLIGDSAISTLLTSSNIQSAQVEAELTKQYKKGTQATKELKISPKLQKILQDAVNGVKNKQQSVEPEHILLALFTDGDNVAARILTQLGFKKEIIEKKVMELSVLTPEVNKTPEELKREELDLMTHLTQRSNRVFLSAQTKAKELKNEYLDSEHILHGLLSDSEIYTFFTELKILPQSIEEELVKFYKKENSQKLPELAPRIKRILDNSLVIARKLGFEFISPEHLLLALYEEGEGVGARVLAKLGLKKEDLNKKITGKKEGLSDGTKEGQMQKSSLDQYTIDLTAKAMQGLLDPVVERSEVIERVIHILSRRSKNNPALVGEAGVGKTAIVEGLAQKIVSKQVPESLFNRRILSLDLMSILAGASHRGEFEERMKNLLEEVKASKGQIILFIDEIHNIMGAGGGEGSSDAANFLKPSLSRGEMQLIGATTLTEYRKYIEKDPALERRFQPVVVPEPTEEQAIKMLKSIKAKYEAFHRVQIPDSAIEAAVKLSKRYVGDRFLPDKAIDLIDEAASAVRLPMISLPEEILSVETRIKEQQQELAECEKRGDSVKARILRSHIDDIQHTLKEKQEEYTFKKAQTNTSVSEAIIKDVVSRWTNIPVSKISGSEMEKLSHLEEIMHERIIGQEEAVSSVAQAVRRGRAGLKSVQRPIGSFIFLGPTGTGKTELAKTLADILFGQEEAMIRFDMTEYMEKHEVAKLLGAPPGYIGYEEGGKLTEAVRRKPYSVVLFDEVEKAHPDIFNILLQILDDGRLTDNKGHVISFKNTVVICTSNLGSQIIQNELLKNGKEQIEEPNAISTYLFSPKGIEILSIGSKYFQRINTGAVSEMNQPKAAPEKHLTTFAFTPRGRQILTVDTQYYERDIDVDSLKNNSQSKAKKDWKNGVLKDYFAGQKIELNDEQQKANEKVEFPDKLFDTHAISPEGVEMISKDGTVYFRNSTTAKVWKSISCIDYVKDNVVINALPDAPEQQLPTAKWQTHAFSNDEKELITLQDRYWRRSMNSTDWETGLLKDHFVNQMIEKGNLPVNRWDIHTYSPAGEELIVTGDSLYVKKTGETKWEMKKVSEYFGEDYPLKTPEIKSEEKKESKPAEVTAPEQKWQEGMLLDYFAGQEIEGAKNITETNEVKKDFPIHGFDTHAIAKTGTEMITKGNTVYMRDSASQKVWKELSLIEYFKDGKVVNALLDAPDEQLPTVSIKTHAYTPESKEIVTYKDRYWTRKQDEKNWDTGFLKDYFINQAIDKGSLPVTYWDIHLFNPSGKEMIIVGENIWFRESGSAKWVTQSVEEYFGKDFPLEKQIEEKTKIDQEIEKKQFLQLKSKIMNELLKFFRPELVNRFDEVIMFEPLRYRHMKKIVIIQLKAVVKAMEEQDMGLACTDSAIKEIVRNGFDPVFGARPLRRAIQKLIENPISSLIIESKMKSGDQVLVDFNGEDFIFNIEKVELVDASKIKQLTVKKFLCQACANTFETETVQNATSVCSKCGSKKLTEIAKDPVKPDENISSAPIKPEEPKKDAPTIGNGIKSNGVIGPHNQDLQSVPTQLAAN